jgi:hypothetical protein
MIRMTLWSYTTLTDSAAAGDAALIAINISSRRQGSTQTVGYNLRGR